MGYLHKPCILWLTRRWTTNTSLISQQDDGGVGVEGEGRQHHLVRDVVVDPTQLLGQVPRRDEAAEDAPILAGRDELQGAFHGRLQVLQRAAHRRVAVRHACLLLQPRQDSAEPEHALPDLPAHLLVLVSLVRCLLDLEPDFHDPVHDGHRIGHPCLSASPQI